MKEKNLLPTEVTLLRNLVIYRMSSLDKEDDKFKIYKDILDKLLKLQK